LVLSPEARSTHLITLPRFAFAARRRSQLPLPPWIHHLFLVPGSVCDLNLVCELGLGTTED
jgi:hypothetical protein